MPQTKNICFSYEQEALSFSIFILDGFKAELEQGKQNQRQLFAPNVIFKGATSPYLSRFSFATCKITFSVRETTKY